MDEVLGGLWHVSDGGLTKGPYTGALLQQRVDNGRISASALVWKEGMTAWQPLPVHFRVTARDPLSSPLRETAFAPPDRKLLRWLVLGVAMAALAVNYTGLIDGDAVSPVLYVMLRLAILLTMVIAGIFAAILWWRAANAGERAGLRRGWWRVLIVTGGVAVAVTLIVIASALPFAYRLEVARASFRDFTLTADAASGTIRMNGIIGPGLARQLATRLQAEPRITTIEINSVGGLVNEALAAAHDIERHGGMTVKAVETCNSACLLIFMSGEKRVAPLDLVFGFHATAPITTVKGVYRLEELAKNGAAADSYLISRGVPAAFVKSARQLGSSKIYRASAIRMADVGAVTQLLDHGRPVSLMQGKWLSVIQGMRRARLPKDGIDFFLLVDRIAPVAAQDFAAKVLERIDQNDAKGVAGLMRELGTTMTNRALPAADDTALAQNVAVLAKELRYVRARERWDICTGALAGRGFGDLKFPDDVAAMEFRASSALVQSAAQNGWVKQRQAPEARAEGRALAKSIAARMAQTGEDVRQFGKDPKIACDWTTNLLSDLSSRPAPETARVYRWLLAQK